MSSHEEKVTQVITDFLKPSTHLLGMQRLHKRLYDEDKTFTQWDQVVDEYRGRDWDEDSVKEFVIRAKQLVEDGVERISETYLNIADPNDLTREKIIDEFEKRPYEEELNEERDGFRYSVNESTLLGRYIYANVRTDVNFAGDVNTIVQESSIPFRVFPEDRLVVIESTGVVDVQKGKSAFGDTELGVTVCGDLTRDPDNAVKRMDSFRDSFSKDMDDTMDEPVRRETDRLQLHNPDATGSSKDIQKMDLEGDDIEGHRYVEERLKEGWIIKGLTTRINFEEEFFDVSVSGNSTMGYAKVEDIGSYEKATRLMDDIRERYLEHFRQPLADV